MFFVKGNDHKVRVFLNTCPHRGALICRLDEGNAKVFQCFYHAWTFDTDGRLLGRPDETGYSDRTEMNLKSPPRVDSYRGFIFVSFNRHAEDLVTYLAGAREYLDLVADQSEEGMTISRGSNRYTVRTNWKLLVENGIDGYHLQPLHWSYFEYAADLTKGMTVEDEDENWRRPGRVRTLGNGHAVVESFGRTGRTVARWHPILGEDTKEEIAGIRKRLVERHGEERTRLIADTYHGVLIYPNLHINDLIYSTVRVSWPIAPDESDVTAWHLAPNGHSANLLARKVGQLRLLPERRGLRDPGRRGGA